MSDALPVYTTVIITFGNGHQQTGKITGDKYLGQIGVQLHNNLKTVFVPRQWVTVTK